MSRYIFGRMSLGTNPARLQVSDEPPRVTVHKGRTSVSVGNYGFAAVRGVVQEWREHSGGAKGARFVLRVFPEAHAADLAAADAKVAEAQRVLDAARRERMDVIEGAIAHAKVPRVAEIQADREAWRARETAKAELSDAQHALTQMTGLMADFVGKTVTTTNEKG